tara:strand:+ start:11336 stop:12013 length:678 start_codon:yes stop_codon:yes gene_type:complete
MSFGIVAAIAAPLVIGGITKAVSNKRARDMEGDIQAANGVVDDLLRDRADVKNPYANVEDRSDQIKNPFENIGVATQAAEMQAEETDIALANTLNTLQASGMGAGGATALAQAAAKSKQGVSATIEAQEADNSKLRAEGEQQAQTARLAEGARVEALKGQGNIFQQQMNEERSNAQIDRAYGESDFLRNQQQSTKDAGDAALMAGITGSTSALTAGLSPGGALAG